MTGVMFVAPFPIACAVYLLFDRPIGCLRRTFVKSRRPSAGLVMS